MERNDTDDKWSCYMMWAIGFVLLIMIVSFFVIYKVNHQYSVRWGK